MFNKFNKVIVNTLEILLLIFSVSMCVDVFMQVILRYFTTISISWMDELARFLLIVSTMIGLPLATYYAVELDVKYFVDLLPRKLRCVVLVIADILCLSFYIALLYHGVRLTQHGMSIISMCLRIPMGYVYAVVPSSSLLCIYFVIIRITNNIKTKGEVA